MPLADWHAQPGLVASLSNMLFTEPSRPMGSMLMKPSPHGSSLAISVNGPAGRVAVAMARHRPLSLPRSATSDLPRMASPAIRRSSRRMQRSRQVPKPHKGRRRCEGLPEALISANLRLVADARGFQPWQHEVNDDEGNQIHRADGQKNRRIAADIFKHITGIFRHQHPADRACHAAYTDD
jgi:hypothetical protein